MAEYTLYIIITITMFIVGEQVNKLLYIYHVFSQPDVLSFVERSESGADGGNVGPRALVLRPAVCDQTDEALVVSTCPADGHTVVSAGRRRRWWSCVFTGGS